MKTLNFTEETKEAFALLYEVVIAYPLKGGIEEILKVATIVEKLKSFGTLKQEKGLFKIYEMKEAKPVELEDDHFKYIKNAFEQTQWSSSIQIEVMAIAARLLKESEK